MPWNFSIASNFTQHQRPSCKATQIWNPHCSDSEERDLFKVGLFLSWIFRSFVCHRKTLLSTGHLGAIKADTQTCISSSWRHLPAWNRPEIMIKKEETPKSTPSHFRLVRQGMHCHMILWYLIWYLLTNWQAWQAPGNRCRIKPAQNRGKISKCVHKSTPTSACSGLEARPFIYHTPSMSLGNDQCTNRDWVKNLSGVASRTEKAKGVRSDGAVPRPANIRGSDRRWCQGCVTQVVMSTACLPWCNVTLVLPPLNPRAEGWTFNGRESWRERKLSREERERESV